MTERSMQEPTLLLLTALADAPRHGYALIQEISAISQGRVTMRAGTLYSALDRLLQQELIRVESDEVVGGRARRTYALTEAGSATLAAEADRLRAVVAEADRRLGTARADRADRAARDGTAARPVIRPVFRLKARGALA
ncbi:PadR family transcriptional regulator [Streptomyces sp. NPDC051567]|uniref:PadR family transcriptional regulator n=1 Tax=Streptomyces sp. NPDC051567 TaxID=3365660 RepID=UPI0037B900BC